MRKKPPMTPNAAADMVRLRKATVGELLRRKRAALGLHQSDVAAELGYTSGQFVSNWERGLGLPPPTALPRLAKVLKIDPSEIIEKVCIFELQSVSMHRTMLARMFQDATA